MNNQSYIQKNKFLNYSNASKPRSKQPLNEPEKNESYHWKSLPLWTMLRGNSTLTTSNVTKETSVNTITTNGLWERKLTNHSSQNLRITPWTQHRWSTPITKGPKLTAPMEEQQPSCMNSSTPLNGATFQPTKHISYWTKQSKVPNDWPSMHGSMPDNRTRTPNNMLQKHSNSHKALDTWNPESLAQNETLLIQNLSNLTMKPASKKICCENQPTTATAIQAEAEVGTIIEDVEGEKTSREDEDVGTSTPTTTSQTILTTTLQLRQNQSTTSSTKTICTTITTPSTILTTTAAISKKSTNHQLLSPIRRHPSGWPPKTIYTTMEIDHQPTMANFSNSTRLQNSICTATDTMEECKEDNNSRRANAHQFSSEEVLGWGHDRDLTNAEPQLSIEIFHPSREDQTPSNLGLPEIKQLHSGRTLQNGGSSRTARIDRERRLYLQNRSERRLRRSSYSPGVTRLLKLRKRRRRLSLQVARLWTKYSTKNLLQDHEICNRTVKKSRNTNYLLPRRPLFVSKNQTRNALSNAKIC
ncbi:hypothetical protein G6F18_012764 [Rhizopus arrhizus]|nr:hypothetical protein G6F18_012764 [Rhizopus arrhizus]